MVREEIFPDRVFPGKVMEIKGTIWHQMSESTFPGN